MKFFNEVFFKSTTIFGFLLLPIMYGCSKDNVVASSPEQELSQEALAKCLPNNSKKNYAIKVAKEFLKSECVMQTNAAWGQTGNIVNAFPVYLDGVDDVSYYECKVQNGGTDAGFILVNINQTDVPIPQYTIEGKTPSEDFAKESGISVENLQVFRHNWFEMLAEKKTSIGLGNGVPVITRGFDEYGEFKKGKSIDRNRLLKIRTEFKHRVQQAEGTNPLYLKTSIRQLHAKDSLISESLKSNPTGLLKAAYSDRWTSDELNNTFSSGWHLPKWYQVKNATNMISGCGPLGVTMMYAYHRQFNGKTNLFNGLDLNPLSGLSGCGQQPVKDITFSIGADCGADYGSSSTSTSLNGLENGGELYGDRLGYDVHLDQDLGGDFTKGKTALDHIRSERPCGFAFDSDKNGSTDHFATIEGVKYLERKYVWNWYNREMWYLTNYGWYNSGNGKREWICVDAQYGSDTYEYKNTGNLYMMWR